jgi:aerobic-type carbon monoxide dehydrogenase small subunit (CoxS/CutS family)
VKVIMEKAITLQVNGQLHPVLIEPDELLVDVLRDRLGLTGTKKGCGTGDCGSCTVLLNGSPVNSCLVLAVSAEGKPILTIEALGDANHLHPLQKSFIDHGAIQCGYCSPGFLMAAKALLDENPDPSEAEVRAAIAGNLCRCTGYAGIVCAILAAAKMMKEAADE